MCVVRTRSLHPKQSLQALSRRGDDTGPRPDLSATPALDINVLLSFTLASFQGRDVAEGIS